MNNVNVESMNQFVATVQANPAEAQKHKEVTGSWVFTEGEPQFTAALAFAHGDVTLHAELPSFAGGWGSSPDPIQYCLYGLAACFAVTYAAAAAGEGVELSRLEVTAENWMDLRKQIGLEGANIVRKVRFTVLAEGASREELDRILALTRERCPGVECITQAVPLEIALR